MCPRTFASRRLELHLSAVIDPILSAFAVVKGVWDKTRLVIDALSTSLKGRCGQTDLLRDREGSKRRRIRLRGRPEERGADSREHGLPIDIRQAQKGRSRLNMVSARVPKNLRESRMQATVTQARVRGLGSSTNATRDRREQHSIAASDSETRREIRRASQESWDSAKR